MNQPSLKPASLRISRIFLALLVLGAGACVTVNVNFPESSVQQASDSYVRDLYRAREKGKPVEPAPSSSPDAGKRGELFPPILIAEALAADEFTVSSAKSKEIASRQKARIDDVLDFKRKGALGESAEGLLVLKDAAKLKKLEAKRVEKLVADENADRKDLYEDVVATNGKDKVQLSVVKKSFTRSFQAASPSGTWVEGADGKWEQKP